MDEASLKKKLKGYLEYNNSSLQEFSKNILNITYDSLMKKMRGDVNFTFEEVDKIVKYCGGSIVYEDFSKSI